MNLVSWCSYPCQKGSLFLSVLMYLVSWCSYPCQKGGPAAFAKKVAFLYSVDLTQGSL